MRFIVDFLGVLLVVLGVFTGTFTLLFGGVLVLLAGACLHTTCLRSRRR